MSRKRQRRDTRPEWKKQQEEQSNFEREDVAYSARRAVKPLEAKTDNQQKFMNAVEAFKLIFATGPAGTGKTYLAGAMAADAILEKRTEKIIITRPAVEAGEQLGFLPGEVEEKYAPYLAPFLDVLNERLGKGRVEYMMKSGQIEAAPLAYMRGRTFKEAWVILDEAQNTTPAQMKMFLTRIGYNCKVLVSGDVMQKDISGESGLVDAVRRLSFIPSVKVIQFTADDIVRSGLVQEIVDAYERPLI
jgi:phosphate starvation-inducible PhoH-like protein